MLEDRPILEGVTPRQLVYIKAAVLEQVRYHLGLNAKDPKVKEAFDAVMKEKPL